MEAKLGEFMRMAGIMKNLKRLISKIEYYFILLFITLSEHFKEK